AVGAAVKASASDRATRIVGFLDMARSSLGSSSMVSGCPAGCTATQRMLRHAHVWGYVKAAARFHAAGKRTPYTSCCACVGPWHLLRAASVLQGEGHANL